MNLPLSPCERIYGFLNYRIAAYNIDKDIEVEYSKRTKIIEPKIFCFGKETARSAAIRFRSPATADHWVHTLSTQKLAFPDGQTEHKVRISLGFDDRSINDRRKEKILRKLRSACFTWSFSEEEVITHWKNGTTTVHCGGKLCKGLQTYEIARWDDVKGMAVWPKKLNYGIWLHIKNTLKHLLE